MANIDIADKATLDNINTIVSRGVVKSVQSGNYVFNTTIDNFADVTISPVNPGKSIVMCQSEDIYAAHYDELGDLVYKTHVSDLIDNGTKIRLYSTYISPKDTMVLWQVIEFY